jgi:hypothetical protein
MYPMTSFTWHWITETNKSTYKVEQGITQVFLRENVQKVVAQSLALNKLVLFKNLSQQMEVYQLYALFMETPLWACLAQAQKDITSVDDWVKGHHELRRGYLQWHSQYLLEHPEGDL